MSLEITNYSIFLAWGLRNEFYLLESMQVRVQELEIPYRLIPKDFGERSDEQPKFKKYPIRYTYMKSENHTNYPKYSQAYDIFLPELLHRKILARIENCPFLILSDY